MNARTQITLDPEVQRRAQTKAAELGISFAEYIRRLVASDLGPNRRKADVSALFDLGASDGVTDIAHDKDRLVAQAVWKDQARTTRRLPRRRVRKA